MSLQSERKGPLILTAEQEARLSVAQLAQQLVDLRIRQSIETDSVIVKHVASTDMRKEREIRTIPYLPVADTQIEDVDHMVRLSFHETPMELTLTMEDGIPEEPTSSISVTFRRRSNEEIYIMVGEPALKDGSPAPTPVVSNLTSEGQTLMDLVRQGI